MMSLGLLAQPVNDDCSSAIAMDANDRCISVSGNNTGASFSGVQGVCSNYPEGIQDVWYTFSVTQSSDIIVNLWKEFSSCESVPCAIFNVYKGSCGQLEYIACGDISFSVRLSNLSIGDELFIQVQGSEGFSQVDFNLCLIYPISSTNDVCSTAIPLSFISECADTKVYSNHFITPESNPSFNSLCTTSTADAWYQITVPASGHIFLSAIHANGGGDGLRNLNLEVFEGACGALTSLSCDNFIIGSQTGISIINRSPGEILYVRALQSSYGSDPYLFCSPLADNDICSTATALSMGERINQDYAFATPSSNPSPQPSCGLSSNFGSDIWYTAIVPASGAMVIHTASFAPIAVEVYRGNCLNLSPIACNREDSLAGLPDIIRGDIFVRTQIQNQNPGDILYIRVISDQSIAGLNIPYIEILECPVEEIITNIISEVSYIEAENIITANSLILNYSIVHFDAGQEINLLSGFEVQQNATFHAFIDGCGGI